MNTRWLGYVAAGVLFMNPDSMAQDVSAPPWPRERQVTRAAHGHILTNTGVWSPDSRWIVYDVRSDPAGEVFDGDRIEAVEVETGVVRTVYRTRNDAKCGVVTFHPSEWRVVFIHGPESPTPDWSYGPYHRQGALVDWGHPESARMLDARDLVEPFTPGALRGGSHVHVYSPDGSRVSFTYEDHVLAVRPAADGADLNQRNIGVSVPGSPVRAGGGHPRNHDGDAFTVLVTRTVNRPRPGTDEIQKAFEEGWVGGRGYQRADGVWQRHALAFQGHVVTTKGDLVSEIFVVDLPEDLTVAGDGPLEGTSLRRPLPPKGTVQRRLTFTTDRKFPGVQGTRHWLRTSPDGAWVAFLMKDDASVPQLHMVPTRGGTLRQVTRLTGAGVGSTFTWSPDGSRVGHVANGQVCVTTMATGETRPLTAASAEASRHPRPEACVFSPDGRHLAYVRRVPTEGGREVNQVFVVDVPVP